MFDRRPFVGRAALAAVLVLAAAGCADGTGSDAPNTVTYVGTDYAFEGPDSIPAGLTTIAIENQGSEAHQAVLIRLPEGQTIEEVMATAADSPSGLPQGVVFEGGPVASMPGQTVATTMNLEPGNYVIVCEIPSSDGVTHSEKGQVLPLEVTGEADDPAAMAPADVAIGLNEYAFSGPELTAGEHTIRLENNGQEVHEALLIKLEEGKTAMDFAAAFEPGAPPGPPPGSVVGGVGGIDPGKVAQFEATFDAGNYAWICFYPAPDGMPHLAKGMVSEFTIAE